MQNSDQLQRVAHNTPEQNMVQLCERCRNFGYCRIEFMLSVDSPAASEEELIEHIPLKDYGRPLLKEAIKHFHAGDYQKALDCLEHFKPATNDPLIWIVSGISNKRLCNYGEAYNDLENFGRYADLNHGQEKGLEELMNLCFSLKELEPNLLVIQQKAKRLQFSTEL